MKIKQLLMTAALGAMLAFTPDAAFAGKADDTLNWSTTREIAVIDPYYNNTRELVVMGHMGWDGLVFRDIDTGEFKPLLATNWEWKGDTAIEMDLRNDVKFHDGSDFDADDVVYTLNHASNKDNGVLTFRNVSWIKNAEKARQPQGPHQPAQTVPAGLCLSRQRGVHHAFRPL